MKKLLVVLAFVPTVASAEFFSGNQLLAKIGEAFLAYMAKMVEQYPYNAERAWKVVEEHEKLLKLFKTRDLDRIRNMLERHIKSMLRMFQQSSREK